jgi:phosphoserine phosphatase RsbX
MLLQVAHRSRPKPGEHENGDAVLVRTSGERMLLAVVDALGHGASAAATSRVALGFLEEVPLRFDVRELLGGLHRALHGTRGVAAFLALHERTTLQYGGVGNVEARATGVRLGVVNVPGVLGHRAPRLRMDTLELAADSRLVVYTDGIQSRFSLRDHEDLEPEDLCRHLISDHARPSDDASVLVADLVPETKPQTTSCRESSSKIPFS